MIVQCICNHFGNMADRQIEHVVSRCLSLRIVAFLITVAVVNHAVIGLSSLVLETTLQVGLAIAANAIFDCTLVQLHVRVAKCGKWLPKTAFGSLERILLNALFDLLGWI